MIFFQILTYLNLSLLFCVSPKNENPSIDKNNDSSTNNNNGSTTITPNFEKLDDSHFIIMNVKNLAEIDVEYILLYFYNEYDNPIDLIHILSLEEIENDSADENVLRIKLPLSSMKEYKNKYFSVEIISKERYKNNFHTKIFFYDEKNDRFRIANNST